MRCIFINKEQHKYLTFDEKEIVIIDLKNITTISQISEVYSLNYWCYRVKTIFISENIVSEVKIIFLLCDDINCEIYYYLIYS